MGAAPSGPANCRGHVRRNTSAVAFLLIFAAKLLAFHDDSRHRLRPSGWAFGETATLVAANDNDPATGWRAVRDRRAFAEVLELSPATIDFDDPEVLLRLIELGNVDPLLRRDVH